MKYDLKDRTVKFGENLINFAKKIPINPVTRPLISQLVRAGTSVGANYSEADNAESRDDFKHKIGICKKESKETEYWLTMVCTANPESKNDSAPLIKEAHELNLIFNAIIHTAKQNN